MFAWWPVDASHHPTQGRAISAWGAMDLVGEAFARHDAWIDDLAA